MTPKTPSARSSSTPSVNYEKYMERGRDIRSAYLAELACALARAIRAGFRANLHRIKTDPAGCNATLRRG